MSLERLEKLYTGSNREEDQIEEMIQEELEDLLEDESKLEVLERLAELDDKEFQDLVVEILNDMD
ncbi:MAG: hypothetical protein ABEJ99_00995 [Candidatus Nanohaloarchaea archaeon]